MSRLLMVWEGQPVTADILQDFFRGFSQQHDCRVTAMQSVNVTEETLRDCDVLLCVRGESPWIAEIMKKARKMGKFVLYFLDDDLKDLPKTELRFPARNKYLRQCLSYAQGFLTSSLLLAQEYVPLTDSSRFVLVETAVAPEEIVPLWHREEGTPVRIVYAGTASHAAQWERFLAPIWPELTQKYGARLSLTFVGMHPVLPEENFGALVEYVPAMSLQKYRAYMCEHHFDIGLAPLQANHFTERKYYNKFLEYAKCGICGIYSACAPYTLIVRDGENGILAQNEPQAWKEALERIIEDEMLSRKCAQGAQELLLQQFTCQSIYARLVQDFPEFVEYCGPAGKTAALSAAAKLRYRVFRLMEIIYLTAKNLCKNGWKETYQKIKNKLKEKRR